MKDQYFNSSTWINRPPMLMLTQIGGGSVNGGQPTKCCIDPAVIALVYRGMSMITGPGTPPSENPEDYTECTIVQMSTGNHVAVVESPETIMQLREKALGNEIAKLKGVD